MGLIRSGVRIAVLLALVAGVLFYLGQGIQDAALEDFTITGVEGVDAEGFTFTGTLTITNPSDLPVPIKSVAYDARLESGEVVTSGQLDAFVLEPGQSETVFSERVEWVPTAQLATRLATQEQVWMVVNGTVYIDIPEVERYAIPFEDRVDIKEYVTQHATESVSGDAGPVEDTTDSLIG